MKVVPDTRGDARVSQSDNIPQSGDSITLDDQRQVIEVLGQSVRGLWEVVNNLTRLRPKKRAEFRVTIFGSARIPRDHWPDFRIWHPKNRVKSHFHCRNSLICKGRAFKNWLCRDYK